MAETKVRPDAQRARAGLSGEPSDGQLLGRFNSRRDDSAEAAFAALIRRHGPMVLRVCDQILGDRHAAEDAFQASFLVLARRADSIRQPELLGNWLYGVALRTAREAKMRDGRRRRFEAPAEVASTGHAAAVGDPGRPDLTLIGREELETLHEELARLPERYRVALVLCELQGLTYGEAAQRLGCPVGTIGARLVRARDRLRSRLIRRGIAPAAAVAMVDALLGEGTAAGLSVIAAGLVEATAGAAGPFAVGDGAAGGLVPASASALAVAVLGSFKLAALKVSAVGLLVVGLGAMMATRGGSRPAEVAATVSAVRVVPESIPLGPVATPPAPPGSPMLASPALPPGAEGSELGVAGPGESRREAAPLGPAPLAAPILAALAPGRAEVTRGEALFLKEWVVADPSSPQGDGLGPVYNATSCIACHGLGAPGGAGPENRNVVLVTATPTGSQPLPKTLGKIHPGLANARSVVVHRYGVDSAYGSWRRSFFEGNRSGQAVKAVSDAAEETPEMRIQQIVGRTGPANRVAQRATRPDGGPGVALRVSERNSPALFGAGRIDSVTAEVLIDEAAAQPGPLRGKVSRMSDGRIGRFGWKGQIAGLHEFVRSACASELGLEVPGHAQAPSPLDSTAQARGLDLTEVDCDDLVAYVRALPSPVAVDPEGPYGIPAMAEGRALFAEVGCATCHVPTLGEVRGIYSDLLLHEMGSRLSDSGSYYGESTESPGSASPGQWRTPPLWGYRDSAPYLHDGRAETLEEAVAFHDGQASTAAHQFFALSEPKRDAVETFLKSLVAPSAASAPGVFLAADLENRIVPPEARQAEAQTRQERKAAEARQIQQRDDTIRRQQAATAALRAVRNYQLGANLDRVGKINGALRYYSETVREAPDTPEGRSAAVRIAVLREKVKTP